MSAQTERAPSDESMGVNLQSNDPGARGLRYPNAFDFMVQYMLPSFQRTLNGEVGWCRQWWYHAEALARVDALWRSFEAHRVSDNASSMAVWWRDFADPTMSALTNPRGVFEKCNGRTGEHVPDDPERLLQSGEPPYGVFTDERTIVPMEFADYDDR